MDLGTVTVETFAPHVGTAFFQEARELTLAEASPLRFGAHIPEARPPFRLTFTGDAPMLPQGIHGLIHVSLGTIEVFLVPIGERSGQFTYEAIFN